MRKGTLILAVATLLGSILLTNSCGTRQSTDVEAEEVSDSIPPLGFWTEDFICSESTVKSGETFSGIMTRLGMSASDAYKLAMLCDTVLDVRKIRAGNSLQAYTDSTTNALKYAVYSIDRTHQAIFKCCDSLAVSIYEKPVSISRKYADVSISSSLWNDMAAAGSSPMLIMKLSDIFAWTIDFFGLRKDDRFQVMYSQSECDGQLLGIDTVYFAKFTRDTTELFALMFDQGDGGNIYWNEKGESMRKAFLKAPLQFTRISSGFSYHRKHPVTGQVKAHTAVDYAAPTGTPVVALGDGTVISAAWAGGGGNTVKIRHNSVYTTSYMHLSKYGRGIKAGVRVQQGQVIGYVGMTGTATGPHLDFRVYQNGAAINPLKLDSPPSEPIKEEFRPALDSIFTVYKAEMDSLAIRR